ncbi:unnamed protein product [Cyprideis torosa]|uniref:Uncharacterized protein n=1 Tax=Cyprideis torosa TaxID=163714 RepID=A0A7R8ZJV5_9CRUS|nr:unnamed protein product [Cyprideis torosa]CAG0879005.1 unnamed protein product [Cyprideis torosa]
MAYVKWAETFEGFHIALKRLAIAHTASFLSKVSSFPRWFSLDRDGPGVPPQLQYTLSTTMTRKRFTSTVQRILQAAQFEEFSVQAMARLFSLQVCLVLLVVVTLFMDEFAEGKKKKYSKCKCKCKCKCKKSKGHSSSSSSSSSYKRSYGDEDGPGLSDDPLKGEKGSSAVPSFMGPSSYAMEYDKDRKSPNDFAKRGGLVNDFINRSKRSVETKSTTNSTLEGMANVSSTTPLLLQESRKSTEQHGEKAKMKLPISDFSSYAAEYDKGRRNDHDDGFAKRFLNAVALEELYSHLGQDHRLSEFHWNPGRTCPPDKRRANFDQQ